MNWLGELVAARVRPHDDVLDFGCGIMPATGGRLAVKRHVGVDSFQPYLDVIGPPAILARLPEATKLFDDNSFDMVLLLDVVEHLSKADAIATIIDSERIARREVIVFTPQGFVPQAGWGAWDMPHNEDQAHLCGFNLSELEQAGYVCSLHDNGTQQVGPIISVFGFKQCLSIQA